MKITARIVYGLQFLIQVAEEGETNYVQIRDVVRKESISEKYLESIVSQLKSAGLLSVKRGAYGGYKLLKPAGEIQLREIFDSLEGLDLVPDNLLGESLNKTDALKAIGDVVVEFQQQVISILSEKTLADIVKQKRGYSSYDDYQI